MLLVVVVKVGQKCSVRSISGNIDRAGSLLTQAEALKTSEGEL